MSDDSKPRILIVDDNLAMLETLSDILTESGYDVDTAATAEAALGLVGSQSYAAAIIDIILPGMNGVELSRRLRQDHPDTRSVIITAYADSELAQDAEDDESIKVLYKPVDPMELLDLVARFTKTDN